MGKQEGWLELDGPIFGYPMPYNRDGNRMDIAFVDHQCFQRFQWGMFIDTYVAGTLSDDRKVRKGYAKGKQFQFEACVGCRRL